MLCSTDIVQTQVKRPGLTASLLTWSSFMDVWPGKSHTPWAQKGPALGFLDDLTRGPTYFPLALGPTISVATPTLNLR